MIGKHALLTGHFSTVGDVESLTVVRGWLDEAGVTYDQAPFFASVHAQMEGVLSLTDLDPSAYTHLVMICGPVWKEQLETVGFNLSAYRHCTRIGVNLTMIAPVAAWNPFEFLFERDSDRLTRPDLTFLADTGSVPVVGRCMVKRQSSYAGRERHEDARRLFDDAIDTNGFAAIDIDTRWYREGNGLRTPEQLLSALQRIDILFTNRLHGMVFALKAGLPVIAIDAVEGGAKVLAQAQEVGWPKCIPIEEATPARLNEAIEWCLTDEAREVARACRDAAAKDLGGLKSQFLTAIGGKPLPH
jgi:polysaccharide pyruvyl transferase